jgi:hypothetical protein
MLLGDRCIVLYSLVLKRFNWMCILLSGINIFVMRFMIYRHKYFFCYLIYNYYFTSLQEIPAAFVSFKTRYGAANAIYIRQSDNPTEWQTEHAPDPHDVYWPFFSTSFMERWISKFVVFVASILLILVFLLVVGFVQGLTYLEQLEKLLPFLKNILEMLVSFIDLYLYFQLFCSHHLKYFI